MAAVSSTRRSTGQPSASSPISRAGVPANSRCACLRVWSRVGTGTRVRPGALPSTANRPIAGRVRAPTRMRSAMLAVGHVPLAAVQHPPGPAAAGPQSARPPRPSGPACSSRASVPIALAGGQARQQVLPGRLVGAAQQRLGGQRHAGQVRRAQQRPAHLLEDDAELDVAEPGALVLLGHGHALQPELVAHLLPDRGVVAGARGHQLAHGLLGRLAGEEVAHRGPQFQLLVREEEVHPASSSLRPLQ